MSSDPLASMNFFLMGREHLLAACNLCRIVEKRRITKGLGMRYVPIKNKQKNQRGVVFK